MPIHPIAILIILLVFMAAAGALAYFVTARRVVVVMDGVSADSRTHQSNVAGLLDELHIANDGSNGISPAPDSPIHDGMTVTVERPKPVIVEADGKRQTVYSRNPDPVAIVQSAGLTVGSDDGLLVDGEPFKAGTSSAMPRYIQIKRARLIRLDNNGTVKTINTLRNTVGEVLYDAGITLYVADIVDPVPSAALPENGMITLRGSLPIMVQVDGRTVTTRTHGKTVGEALADVGLGLVGLDYAVPDISTSVTPNMTIRVVRVTEEDLSEESALNFKKTTQPDPTLPLGTRQIIQQGIPGVQKQQVLVRREDGVEVSRSVPQIVVAQAPRDEITAIGTLPTIKTISTDSGSIQYWRVIKMRAASYKPSSTGKAPDDPTYGVTATGEHLHKGIVAVDPSVIPLGTPLYIPGYGTAIAADTGGAVIGLTIDLGYGDDDYQEWSGEVEVYLMPPVPAAEDVPLLPEEAKQP